MITQNWMRKIPQNSNPSIWSNKKLLNGFLGMLSPNWRLALKAPIFLSLRTETDLRFLTNIFNK